MSDVSHLPPPARRAAPTQAAEGLPRRRWTVDEVHAMTRAGILREDERFELIGGEAVPMNAEGLLHERWKAALLTRFVRAAPDRLVVVPETTFVLADDTFLEPDIVVFARETRLADLTGTNALLIVEIADTTLKLDRGRKAALYAAHGVRDYWFVDCSSVVTHVHRDPSPAGFRHVATHPAAAVLTPLLAPDLSVAMGTLDLP